MTPDDITPDTDEAKQAPGSVEYVEEVVEYEDTRRLRTVLAIVLGVLVLLLAGIGYAIFTLSAGQGAGIVKGGPNEMQWVRSIYGWGTTADTQLIAPTSVAVSGDGTIWTNSRNRMAVAFTPTGDFDRVLMSKQPTATTTPQHGMTPTATAPAAPIGGGVQAVNSVSADSNDNLIIADNARYNVLKFTQDAHLLHGWGVPGVNKAKGNDARVAIITASSLGVFRQDTGSALWAVGSRGQGVNQFDLPVGVFIDKNNFVYVADTQNQRVKKFSPDGKLLWTAGTAPNRAKPQTGHNVIPETQLFDLPSGLTVDGNGRVVVADAFLYQLVVLDGQTGKKIAAYGDFGPLDGQFDSPSDIAYDSTRDQFVVADTGNNRLEVIRLPGSGNAQAQTLARRLFDKPWWILCCPVIILALVALVLAWMRRRRMADEEAAAAAAETPAVQEPPATE